MPGEASKPEGHDPIQQAAERTNYPAAAFHFVLAGILRPVESELYRRPEAPPSHVSGAELCWRLRNLALCRFGGRALERLHAWNIYSCEDFGQIVFKMIEAGLMSKTDSDALDDFNGVYDFEEEFTVDARPTREAGGARFRFGLLSLFLATTLAAIAMAGFSQAGAGGAFAMLGMSWIGLIGAISLYCSIVPWQRGSLLGVAIGTLFLVLGLFGFLMIILSS